MSNDLTRIAEDSARGGFFLASGAIAATVVSAVATILVGRFLGPELYGQYTLSLVIPGMLFTFADFGIGQGIVKFAASLQAEGKMGHAAKIIKYATLLKASIGLAFFILNFALANFFATVLLHRPELGFYLRIASVTLVFQTVQAAATSAYLGLDKTEYSAVTSNIQAISKAVVSIALVLLGFSVAGAVLGHVTGWISGGVVGFSILLLVLHKSDEDGDAKKHGDSPTFNQTLRSLMSYGIPLYISAILVGFIYPYQNIILGIFVANTDIGNLKAAANFVTLITVVSLPIATALFPAFSKITATRNEKTKTFFKFANKYTTLLIVPIAILLLILSDEIVQIIYGATYETAAFFLSVYCLLYLLVGLGYLTLTSLFNGLGETRITLTTSLITFLAILTLTPLLTNAYGVPGSIIALISANATSTCYGMYVAKRNFQIRFDTESLIKIYTIGGASAVPSLLLLQISPLPTLLNAVVGGLLYTFIYATLASLAKIISASELETAIEITQKTKPLALLIKPFLWYHKKLLKRRNSTDRSF